MVGGMHSLSACITSALALKPSTVYILRVEDAKTRQSWHLRRCFSEFAELREKLLALVDDTLASDLARQQLDVSELSASASTLSSSDSSAVSAAEAPGRFAFLFKQFPPRRLFGSRSKRVIESRSQALNQFLRQALQVVEAVRQRQQIAVAFSMMTHLETFLECAGHREAPRRTQTSAKRSSKPLRRGTVSPGAIRRTSAAMTLTPGFHHYPLVPTTAFAMAQRPLHRQPSDSEDEAPSSDDDSSSDGEHFNNFQFTRRFYREWGPDSDATATQEDSDDEEMHILKKTWSAMLAREVRECTLHHSGSHYAMLEGSHDASRRRVLPAEAWAARVQIAGINDVATATTPANYQQGKGEGSSAQQAIRSATPPKSALPSSSTSSLRRHRSNRRISTQHFSTCA